MGLSMTQLDAERFDALLQRAQEGDRDAWTDLYHDVAPLVLGYLRARRADQPEDLTGEVMLQVVRDIATFGGTHERFRSWVLSIAHNRLIDEARYRARRPVVPTDTAELEPDADPRDDPAHTLLESVELHDAVALLDPLTDDQREVILMRVVAGLSVRETARALGKRPGAIKALQFRALERLRRHLPEPDGRAERAPPRAERS
jgi:RNA polymerase sigma-70 factor, ECF subfamily